MATSNSIDLIVNAGDIIQEALEILGVLPEGDAPTQDQIDSSIRTLNFMIKSWQTRKLNLWALQRLYMFPQKNTSEYSLSSSSSTKFTSQYYQTQTSAASSSGGSTITVDADTNISNADVIGVELDGGTIQWTTVNGAPAANVVTLTDTLTDNVSIDAMVFNYTTVGNRPMRIEEAYRRSYSGSTYTDIPIDIMSRIEYFELNNKLSDGVINQVYYDPQISAGNLFVWPQTSVETDLLVMWVRRTLADFDATSDDVDFPQEWYMCLAWNLAMWLNTKYGVSNETYMKVVRGAQELLVDAESFDIEDTSIDFQPNPYGR